MKLSESGFLIPVIDHVKSNFCVLYRAQNMSFWPAESDLFAHITQKTYKTCIYSFVWNLWNHWKTRLWSLPQQTNKSTNFPRAKTLIAACVTAAVSIVVQFRVYLRSPHILFSSSVSCITQIFFPSSLPTSFDFAAAAAAAMVIHVMY